MYTDLFNSNAVLRSCENPSSSFFSTLCSTFFDVSRSLCNQNNTPPNVMEVLKAEVLKEMVDNRTWEVCSSAAYLGYLLPNVFGFIARDQAQCKHFCVDNLQLSPVCRWLVAAALRYSSAATASSKKAGEATGGNKTPTDATKDEGASASGDSKAQTGAAVKTDSEPQDNANTEGKVPGNGTDGSGSSIPAGTGGDAATEPKNTQLTPQSPLNTTSLGVQQVSTNTTGVAHQPVSLSQKPVPLSENAVGSDQNVSGGNAASNPATNAVVGSSATKGESQMNKTAMEATSDQKTGSQSHWDNISKAANLPPNGNATQGSGVAATTKPEGNPPAQNISNVTTPPDSVKTTQQPRVAETANPKGNQPPGQALSGNSPQPGSTTTSTPTTSKPLQPQMAVDSDVKKEQDQENTVGGGSSNQDHLIPPSQDTHLIPPHNGEIQRPLPVDLEEEQKPPSSFQAGMPEDGIQRVYHVSEDGLEDDEAPSGHFMAYFVTAVVLCVAGYVIYHNKQKIFAFVLEGRRDAQQRRRASGGNSSASSSAKYHKLKPSVEEVMPSLEKSTTSTNYIY